MEEASIILDRQSFEALAADTRVKILKTLVKRRKTLSELSKELKMSVSGVKEHLETLEKAGLIEKIDDGHKWKYYELTDKGAAIVAPKPSMRIMLLLSLSIVAFMASAFMMLLPPADNYAMTAEIPPADMQKMTEPDLGGMEESYDYDAEADSEISDGATAGSAEVPLAARNAEIIENELMISEIQTMEEPRTEPEVPLPLIVAMLSLGTMLICFYELSKRR